MIYSSFRSNIGTNERVSERFLVLKSEVDVPLNRMVSTVKKKSILGSIGSHASANFRDTQYLHELINIGTNLSHS